MSYIVNTNPVKPALLALLHLFCFLPCATTHAQVTIDWHKAYGGYDEDGADAITIVGVTDIKQTADGGYIFIAATASTDGDISGRRGGYTDAWVVKMNYRGAIQWKKCFGTRYDDFGTCIIQTKDGGYVFGGYMKKGFAGGGWVVKLDRGGNQSWQTYAGGPIINIRQTEDGGYIANSQRDAFKLDAAGNLVSGVTQGNPTTDGNLIHGCYDAKGPFGNYDGIVTKRDTSGDTIWQTYIGGSNIDLIFSAVETRDKNYVAMGYSYSNDGNVGNNRDSLGWTSDFMIAKLDDTGKVMWVKTYGGTWVDMAFSMTETYDGNLIVAGYTTSEDGDVHGYHGGDDTKGDMWMICLDKDGNLLWQKVIGGSGDEKAYCIIPTADYGYMIAGITGSRDHDASGSGYHYDYWGRHDVWLVKLVTPKTGISTFPSANTAQDIQVYPTITSRDVHIKLPADYGEPVIQLYNTNGQAIPFTINNNGLEPTVTLANVPAGMYLLCITSNDVTSTHKIIYQP